MLATYACTTGMIRYDVLAGVLGRLSFCGESKAPPSTGSNVSSSSSSSRVVEHQQQEEEEV